MKCPTMLLVAAAATPFLHALAVSVTVGSSDPSFSYIPNDGTSWVPIAAPDAFQGHALFLLTNDNEGIITLKSAQAFVGFEFWGYQRSDGGVYGITFDGAGSTRIDVYNNTAQGSDPPVLLFTKDGLANTPHTVVITNLDDTRTPRGFGQMNVDRVVLTTADGSSSSSSSSSSSTTSSSTSTSSSSTTATSSSTSSSASKSASSTLPGTGASGGVAPPTTGSGQSMSGGDTTGTTGGDNTTTPTTNNNTAIAVPVPGVRVTSALLVVAGAALFL